MSEEGGLNSDTFYEAPTQKERKYNVKQRNKKQLSSGKLSFGGTS